jgi:hypothetical protein
LISSCLSANKQIKTITNIQNKHLFIKKSLKKKEKKRKGLLVKTKSWLRLKIMVVAIEDGRGEENCGRRDADQIDS